MAAGRWRCVALGLGGLLGLALGAAASDDDPVMRRGAELLAPFKRDLKQALGEGLARGPVEAVAACQLRAPEIASALSQADVRVGRSSHRLRNPRNAPPAWVEPILDAYVEDAAQRTPRTAQLGYGRTGYVEPIALGPMCVTCHGETLAPAVADRIERLYPQDRAVGFAVGDLRGVFWVEFPTPEPGAETATGMGGPTGAGTH